jgi:hypothetical protein
MKAYKALDGGQQAFRGKYDLDLSSMEKIKINVLAAGEVKLLTSIREGR